MTFRNYVYFNPRVGFSINEGRFPSLCVHWVEGIFFYLALRVFGVAMRLIRKPSEGWSFERYDLLQGKNLRERFRAYLTYRERHCRIGKIDSRQP